MAKPTVLVVDGNETRRRDLVRGLAGFGYEVVAAATADEGNRFAAGITPGVIVAEAALVDETDPFGARSAVGATEEAPPTTVLLVEGEAAPGAAAGVFIIPARATPFEALLRQVRTALLGRELGLKCDPLLCSVVGDLQAVPLFELLPLLHGARVTGHVRTGDGELVLEEGEVTAARFDALRGAKAFSRLARTAAGGFRVRLVTPQVPRELFKDLLSLMADAMEDQHRYEEARARLPLLSSRVKVGRVAAASTTPLPGGQRAVLKGVGTGRTVWQVLDLAADNDGAVLADLAHLHALGIVEFDAPEGTVRIVTDSAADLPAEFARRQQIRIIPLSVTFGADVYKDSLDLTPEVFYDLLTKRGGVYPLAGAPTSGEFLDEYRMLVERSDVVSVHLSERLSQTVVNARTAARDGAEEFGRLRGDGSPVVEVVDSGQVGPGLALLALMAARMAQRRLPAHEMRARLEAMRRRVHLLLVADTPAYLARGGRLGRAQAWLGGRLGVKPILAVEEGEVVPVDRGRRGDAAHARVIELLKQRVDVARPVIAGVGHASSPVQAVRLRSLLQDSFTVSEIIEGEMGPVVGTLIGPGGVGAAVFQPTEEERPLVAPVTDGW